MNEKSNNLDSFKCPKCKDTYWIVGGNNFTRCECFELEEAEKLFGNSGIKDENYTFSNFEEWNEIAKEMKTAATNYYKNFTSIKDSRQNSIGFFGQVGSGKSHLTIALGLNILRQKKLSVVYFSYRDTITELKQNMLDEVFYKKQLYKYQTSKVLLIDDLLKGKTTESDKNIMFEIINIYSLNL